MQIKRWFVCASTVLTVCMLYSCASPSDTSRQSSLQTMSVEDAREFILSEAKQQESVRKVQIQTTKITGYWTVESRDGDKEYEATIRIKDIAPSIEINDEFLNGFTSVYFVNPSKKHNIIFSKRTTHWTDSQRLVDALLVLKNAALKAEEDEEARFQEAARNYRTSSIKPQLPEAARRFKVQAESAISEKDFNAAADFYEQALGVAPWWPAGHFNRDLVLSETGEFSDAVAEMRRYLEVVPEAPDARAAQDKIYAWESNAGKSD
jgi:tetratricopeptide (TPR) repeat protein